MKAFKIREVFIVAGVNSPGKAMQAKADDKAVAFRRPAGSCVLLEGNINIVQVRQYVWITLMLKSRLLVDVYLPVQRR